MTGNKEDRPLTGAEAAEFAAQILEGDKARLTEYYRLKSVKLKAKCVELERYIKVMSTVNESRIAKIQKLEETLEKLERKLAKLGLLNV